MKRVLCPKCENYLYFDETKYSEGQSLVFECEHCGKQFSIRLGKSKVKALKRRKSGRRSRSTQRRIRIYHSDRKYIRL